MNDAPHIDDRSRRDAPSPSPDTAEPKSDFLAPRFSCAVVLLAFAGAYCLLGLIGAGSFARVALVLALAASFSLAAGAVDMAARPGGAGAPRYSWRTLILGQLFLFCVIGVVLSVPRGNVVAGVVTQFVLSAAFFASAWKDAHPSHPPATSGEDADEEPGAGGSAGAGAP